MTACSTCHPIAPKKSTMRVKKPTSKRVTTRMREGIKRKAAAHRRKERKLAKKDVTWRSKHRKDPGIPANYPYKEQILEEIEEGRRQEQQRREEQRLKAKAEREARQIEGDEEMDVEPEEGNGLEALMEAAQAAAREYEGNEPEPAEGSDDDVEHELDVEIYRNDAEKLRKAYDKIFRSVVEASDVVLYVLDARDPEATRLRTVEQAVVESGKKRLIFVLNKVDLVPTAVLTSWLNFLKLLFPTIPVKASPGSSGANTFNKNMLSSASASTVLQALKSYANKQNLKRSIIVGVIGYPNVGKSSIINALTNRHGQSRACPVGNVAGVTTTMREVKIDGKLKILDSPGIVFPDEVAAKLATQQAKLALLAAVPPKAVHDPVGAVEYMLKRVAKDDAMANAVKEHYSLPPLPSHDAQEFTRHFLIHIARTRGKLGRGGIPNLEGAAFTVLNDWRDGRITGWVLPNIKETKTAAAPKPETVVVTEWAKEFDLDGLLGDNFGL